LDLFNDVLNIEILEPVLAKSAARFIQPLEEIGAVQTRHVSWCLDTHRFVLRLSQAELRQTRLQYSTLTRNRPRAGAAGPRAIPEPGVSRGSMSRRVRLPLPTSKRTPTMLRTMCLRNPPPRTR